MRDSREVASRVLLSPVVPVSRASYEHPVKWRFVWWLLAAVMAGAGAGRAAEQRASGTFDGVRALWVLRALPPDYYRLEADGPEINIFSRTRTWVGRCDWAAPGVTEVPLPEVGPATPLAVRAGASGELYLLTANLPPPLSPARTTPWGGVVDFVATEAALRRLRSDMSVEWSAGFAPKGVGPFLLVTSQTLLTWGDRLRAYSPTTGELLWDTKQRLEAVIDGRGAVVVYIETATELEDNLIVRGLPGGEVLGRRTIPCGYHLVFPPRESASPTTGEQAWFLWGGQRGTVFRLIPPAWEPRPVLPRLDGHLVWADEQGRWVALVSFKRQALVCHDLERHTAWEAQVAQWFYTLVLTRLPGDRVMVRGPEAIQALDLRDGSVAWTYPLASEEARSLGVPHEAWVSDGLAWLKFTKGLLVLDPQTGTELWRFTPAALGLTGGFQDAVPVGSVVVAVTRAGEMVALQAEERRDARGGVTIATQDGRARVVP